MRAAVAQGDSHAARAHSDSLIEVAHRLGNRRALAIAGTGLARALLLEGDLGRAEAVGHEALGFLLEHHWRLDAIAAVEVVAAVAAVSGRAEQASRLFAAMAAQRVQFGVVRVPPETPVWDGYLASAREALGPAGFAAAWDQGASLSLDEAAAYARRGRGPHTRAAAGWRGLSPVEVQVARLAAGGRSNAQIAQELFISRSTVKAHLSHIYAKVGVANRVELARVSAGRLG
jgi:DNA-binding CsgD family transcriptional regulator